MTHAPIAAVYKWRSKERNSTPASKAFKKRESPSPALVTLEQNRSDTHHCIRCVHLFHWDYLGEGGQGGRAARHFAYVDSLYVGALAD